MKSVILHYHLFKNAGTSLDRVLQRNFPSGWVSEEFPGNRNNTAQVTNWMTGKADATVFSSHTAIGPLPEIPDTRVFSIMFFRDPIDRILSAYNFERVQKTDGFGAVLAKSTSLSGYVRTRLESPRDRQCRNFQTYRLASLLPGPAPEIERARAALRLISFAGLVDQFEASGQLLETALRKTWPDFTFFDVHANRATINEGRQQLDDDLRELLEVNNADDRALLADFDNTPVLNSDWKN
ncbi:MAG: sulfotransferase family 2 domain-containing protein [Paracoccaceae bacterium]